jgi:hypothetical protein
MSFNPVREITHAELSLNHAPADVFPLFGPVLEKRWEPDWDPQIIYAETDEAAEKGAVFTTQHPAGPVTVWTITHYDLADHAIEYVRVTPGIALVHIAIRCEPAPGDTTRAEVAYTLTGLSEQGNAHVTAVANDHRRNLKHHWEQAINRALGRDITS